MPEEDKAPIVDYERGETAAQKADRDWGELLQEMRVLETGTQILGGFLLTLPFQQRFSTLDDLQRTFYLVLVLLAAAVIVLVLTPVGLHRTRFRDRIKGLLVDKAAIFVRTALWGAGLVMAGTTAFVFDIILGHLAGIIVLAPLLMMVSSLWFIYPRSLRRHGKDGT